MNNKNDLKRTTLNNPGIIKTYEDFVEVTDNFKSEIPCLAIINKQFAEKLLEHNTANRNEKKGAQRRYKQDMETGNFVYNGDTITMAHNGILMDGQNRLISIIDTNSTIKTILTCAPYEAFRTKDSGVTRSTKDMFSIDERPNAMILSTTLKILYSYKLGKLEEAMYGDNANRNTHGSSPVTNSILAEFDEAMGSENRDELDFWVTESKTWNRLATKSRIRLNATRACALAYIWSKAFGQLVVQDFFALISTGIDKNGVGVGPNNQPVIFYVREELGKIEMAKDSSASARGDAAAMLINAFQLWRVRRLVKSKQKIFYSNKINKEFPRVLGMAE